MKQRKLILIHLCGRHGRRPRIQKIKCLAQKMTKWQMIEKLWQKYEIDKFLKIERFELCKICYRLSTKWLSFRSKWSDFDETGLYNFVITNGEKSQISRNLRNYGISKPWAKSAPPPFVTNRVKYSIMNHELWWYSFSYNIKRVEWRHNRTNLNLLDSLLQETCIQIDT